MRQCNGKVYTTTGKSKGYPRIERAYENGVGHPNCKCEFTIYWDRLQLRGQQERTTKEAYEEDQKTKAIEREIRKQRNDLQLYEMIGNQEEADKTRQKISRLRAKL